MREIMFRGFTKFNNKWLYYSAEDAINFNVVDQLSVGEFIGVYDEYNTRIFEGDILKIENGYYVVYFDNGIWLGKNLKKNQKPAFIDFIKEKSEVVGNIYERNFYFTK